jgi:hypothetical protein
MRIKTITLSLLAATALVPASAGAAVIIVGANTIQGDNVLFNAGTQTGTTVTGTTQGGTTVNIMGTTLGGGTTIAANGGQARVEGAGGLDLTGVMFSLAGMAPFGSVEFNMFSATQGTLVNFSILGSSGTTYTFNNQAIGNGGNFIAFQGVGENITKVTYTTAGTGSFKDQRQLRLGNPIAAVPEAATWAMMFAGFGLLGSSMRRRSTQARLRFAF